MFSHEFFNSLILHDFDFEKEIEIIDYYINFLKGLALKLDKDTINFFFNDKVKTFPLYSQAIKFYNYKDPLVRTSIRTIALTCYSLQSEEMK